MEELKKTLALKALVVRNGGLVEVDASEVVPGDILKIDEVYRCCHTNFLYSGIPD